MTPFIKVIGAISGGGDWSTNIEYYIVYYGLPTILFVGAEAIHEHYCGGA